MYDEIIDHGVPLPGSDPERRKQIKAQMSILKAELLYLSLQGRIPQDAKMTEETSETPHS